MARFKNKPAKSPKRRVCPHCGARHNNKYKSHDIGLPREQQKKFPALFTVPQ